MNPQFLRLLILGIALWPLGANAENAIVIQQTGSPLKIVSYGSVPGLVENAGATFRFVSMLTTR